MSGFYGAPFEADWTPVLTAQTPGDLAVTYSVQVGKSVRDGNLVTVHFAIVTSAYTFTTASGTLRISGLPYTARSTANLSFVGSVQWSGITKAGYTDVVPRAEGSNTYMVFIANGSGVATAAVSMTDAPSGGSITLRGTITYLTG